MLWSGLESVAGFGYSIENENLISRVLLQTHVHVLQSSLCPHHNNIECFVKVHGLNSEINRNV